MRYPRLVINNRLDINTLQLKEEPFMCIWEVDDYDYLINGEFVDDSNTPSGSFCTIVPIQ